MQLESFCCCRLLLHDPSAAAPLRLVLTSLALHDAPLAPPPFVRGPRDRFQPTKLPAKVTTARGKGACASPGLYSKKVQMTARYDRTTASAPPGCSPRSPPRATRMRFESPCHTMTQAWSRRPDGSQLSGGGDSACSTSDCNLSSTR